MFVARLRNLILNHEEEKCRIISEFKRHSSEVKLISDFGLIATVFLSIACRRAKLNSIEFFSDSIKGHALRYRKAFVFLMEFSLVQAFLPSFGSISSATKKCETEIFKQRFFSIFPQLWCKICSKDDRKRDEEPLDKVTFINILRMFQRSAMRRFCFNFKQQRWSRPRRKPQRIIIHGSRASRIVVGPQLGFTNRANIAIISVISFTFPTKRAANASL